ncbi:carboxylesterase from carbohydrate esterase, partial [Viridothelium virens]
NTGSLSSHNDSVLILNSISTQREANAKCGELREQLWTPDVQTAKSLLQYLNYTNPSGWSAHYWTNGAVGSQCATIDRDGAISLEDCQLSYPALCTQTADLSTALKVDTSKRWQVAVVTGGHAIVGYRDKLSFRFQGVRYATQPKRFTYSTPYQAKGNQSALQAGNQCVQGGNIGDEDCLFLNIWSTYLPLNGARTTENLKPVMFWIHGGAFMDGSGSDPTFDGGNLASRGDVVVVTINYRLSTLGFLALNDSVTNGNYGISDQVTALDWVQAHIADFGGDPDRVTIFGQSAGAASVRALLASPKAVGKFSAAIMESNLAGANYATTYSLYYNISEEMNVAARKILEHEGCFVASSQVDCLRAKNAYELANLGSAAPLSRFIVVDGDYVVHDELPLSGSAATAHVPVLMGSMRDDGVIFTTFPNTTNSTAAIISNDYNASIVEDQELFPLPTDVFKNETDALFNTISRVTTDAEFRCLDYATAYSGTEHGVFPSVFYYEFNRSYQGFFSNPDYSCNPPPSTSHVWGDPSEEYYKCHSGDLFYVFGNIIRSGLPQRDADDIPFSQYILDSWTSFARTHNPNPDIGYLIARGYGNTIHQIQTAGVWEPFNTSQPSYRQLQWPSIQMPLNDGPQCQALGFPLDYYDKPRGLANVGLVDRLGSGDGE